ncbi:hypothetical protein CF394_13020, partial [Tetzosporium hominis]
RLDNRLGFCKGALALEMTIDIIAAAADNIACTFDRNSPNLAAAHDTKLTNPALMLAHTAVKNTDIAEKISILYPRSEERL